MLEKLMSMLNRGGTVTVAEMARNLDTTPEVVAGMIDHMTRTGQLQPDECELRSGLQSVPAGARLPQAAAQPGVAHG